jgi:hypothetical protein
MENRLSRGDYGVRPGAMIGGGFLTQYVRRAGNGKTGRLEERAVRSRSENIQKNI